MWDDYGQQPEIKNYITRINYYYARLRFYKFQSGIFVFIHPRCRSPPLSFRFHQTQNRKDGTVMKTINLKDYYAHISIGTYIDIPNEVFNIFEEYRKAEQAYQSRIRYHKAYYSLDRGDGIEHSALFVSLSPDEIYERKLTSEQLHAAIATLPDKQAKRIYAHYFLGMSKTAIAKAEGVSETAVRIGIEKALINLKKIFKKSF